MLRCEPPFGILATQRARPVEVPAAQPLAGLDDKWEERCEPDARQPLLAGERRREQTSLTAGQLGREVISSTGKSEIARAFGMGGESPLAGSRRIVNALTTVPRPITMNASAKRVDDLGLPTNERSCVATSHRLRDHVDSVQRYHGRVGCCAWLTRRAHEVTSPPGNDSHCGASKARAQRNDDRRILLGSSAVRKGLTPR
jgi:hypothetical protein